MDADSAAHAEGGYNSGFSPSGDSLGDDKNIVGSRRYGKDDGGAEKTENRVKGHRAPNRQQLDLIPD